MSDEPEEQHPFLKKVFMYAAATPAFLKTLTKTTEPDHTDYLKVAFAMTKGANLYDKITGTTPRNTVGQELEYQKSRQGQQPNL